MRRELWRGEARTAKLGRRATTSGAACEADIAKLACARLVDPGESASAAPRTVLSEVLERRHQHLHESVAADLADHFHFVPRLPNVHVSPVERGREEMRRQMKNRV